MHYQKRLPLGLLITISCVVLTGCQKSKVEHVYRQKAKWQVTQVTVAIHQLLRDCGTNVVTDLSLPDDLRRASRIPGWRGPYLREDPSHTSDPWGNDLKYRLVLEVVSTGADGALATEDDISAEVSVWSSNSKTPEAEGIAVRHGDKTLREQEPNN